MCEIFETLHDGDLDQAVHAHIGYGDQFFQLFISQYS